MSDYSTFLNKYQSKSASKQHEIEFTLNDCVEIIQRIGEPAFMSLLHARINGGCYEDTE